MRSLAIDTPPATERQRTFLASLAAERDWADRLDGQLWETAQDSCIPGHFISKAEASAAITALLACPKLNRGPAARPAAPTLADLPLCKYLVTGDAGQRVHLEVVERRNGRRFLNVLVGAPGDWHRQNVSMAVQATLAAKVRTATYTDRVEVEGALVVRELAGPEAAAVRYSREHKRCSACESPLSDESQPGYAFGLGPVCRTRFGH